MREPPQLAHPTIIAALEEHYRVCVTALAFLPLGMDSDSAAYRVEAAAGMAYFLKVRSGHGFSPSSLAVPHYLHQRGLPHVLAPLPTIAGDLWAHAGAFALSLYPYIDGRSGADLGLSETDWRALGALVRQIHDAGLPPEILALLRGEAFVPSRRQVLARLQGAIACHNLTDPAQAELAAFWRSLQQTIDTVVDRADALGPQLRQASLPRVLCHADLHAWNALVDADGQWWLVDWDEAVMAPRERDLMFVVGGIGRDLVSARHTRCFCQGYGETELHAQALAYYRNAWALQDMAAYGERLFDFPHLSEASRRDALGGFIGLFEPGNIVDIALASGGVAR